MKFIPAHTKAYLGLLLRVSPEEVTKQRVTFTLIPESPEAKADSNRPIQAYKSFDEYDMTLEDLNQRGYGIFVSVNHSGSNLRTKNDIQQIRAVQADFDFKSAEPENDFETSQQVSEFCASLPLTPDLIVVSGHGYHTYWIFPEPLTNTLINRERCELVMQGIAQKYRAYGADPAVADIARVLRVPGYNNVKADPQLVRLLESSYGYYEGTSQEYLDELLEAYPAQTTQQIRVEYEQTVEDETKLALAKEWLSNKEPSVQGDGGSNACMSAAWVGPGFNLDKQTTLNLMLEIFNPTCNPAWSIEELKHKISGAYESAQDKGMIGCYLPDYQKQATKQALLTGFEVEDVQETERLERQADADEKLPQISTGNEINERCSKQDFDDYGFAMRLKIRYNKTLQYYKNDWYHYDGRYWVANCAEAPVRALARVKQHIKQEFPYYANPEKIDVAIKWASSLGSTSHLLGAVRLATSLLARDKELNGFIPPSNTMVNFKNGTMELTTGVMHSHIPEDNLIHCQPYDYNPDAKCPQWEKYLKTVFGGDEEMVNFVRALLGCTLLSNTDNEFAVWLSGSGSNGKTTFTETIQFVLGELAQQIPNDLFLTRKFIPHSTEIARLNQIKFATCSDLSSSATLDEGQFKRLVSTGNATGRYMNQNYADFKMTHKFWISVNSLPNVHDDTNGMWRRMIVIPFNVIFNNDQSSNNKADLKIKDKLKSEVEGIWAWLISAAMDFHLNGLPPHPKMVREAGLEWKQNEDWWSLFVADKCVIDKARIVKSSDLYNSFSFWADHNSQTNMRHKSFSKKVAQMGFKSCHRHDGTYFQGIGLIFDNYDSNTHLL